jgi:hypothetical protein
MVLLADNLRSCNNSTGEGYSSNRCSWRSQWGSMTRARETARADLHFVPLQPPDSNRQDALPEGATLLKHWPGGL